MVLLNPRGVNGSGLDGWSAADVDERETLEEMAVVKRLRRFGVCNNSHAVPLSTGHATKEFEQTDSGRRSRNAWK
jgi:hypothetical protein